MFTINKKHFLYGFALLSPLMGSQSHAYSLDLSAASAFNGLVFGNMTANNSDVEGSLAVGGNLTLTDYAIGLQLDISNGLRDDLIVGGDLNFTDGHVYHGNIRTGGSAELINIGFDDSTQSQIDGNHINGNPLDFSHIEQQLRQNSSDWAGFSVNGTATLDSSSGELQLTGQSSSVNIFSLSGNQLQNTNVFSLDIPDASWALINVSGSDVSMEDFGFFRTDTAGNTTNVSSLERHDGSLTQTVLFNIFEANTLNISGIGIGGSILAPFADTVFYDGHLDGQLIVNSLQSMQGELSGQLNHYNFLATNNVPEPSSFWLLSISGLLLYRFRIAAQR